MEDILSQAITTILVNLQHQYANDPDALLYFCINQSHMVGGIRSSVHSLNYNRPDQMVKQFMADFYHYINSNADVKLDATFECYFHILSSQTLSKPGHRRKAVPIRSLVGAYDSDNANFKPLMKGSLINLPPGYPDKPHCFENACLIVTVVFMAIKKLQPDLYSSISKLLFVKPKKSYKNAAGAVLLNEVEQICAETNLNLEGPHELKPTLKVLSEKLKANLIVIISLEGNKPDITCHPDVFDDSLPRLYFLLQNNHILGIDNLSTFCKVNKRGLCFKCDHCYYIDYGVGHNRHKCRNTAACRKCFGFQCQNSTVTDKTEPWWYCDAVNLADQGNIYSKTCYKCGTTFTSLLCFENHLQYFCKTNSYYYQCPVCQKSIAMNKRTVEKIQSEHKCYVDEAYCKVCLKILPISHICTLKKIDKDKIWPNLGVLSLTFEDAVGALCQLCYVRQSEYMLAHNLTYSKFFQSSQYQELLCDAHKTDRVSVPNVIKIFYEKDRFAFVGRTFSNADFLASNTNLNETFYCSYSSHFKPKSTGTTNATVSQTSNNLKLVSKQFLCFLKSECLSHYTFVVHSAKEMSWLLDLFLSNSENPTAIQAGRVVKKISLTHRKINFILFENYCKGSLNDLSDQFNLGRSALYFPMAYNQSKYYGLIITKPVFETFVTFNDTEQEILLKQQYYSELPLKFDVNVELYKVITENLKTFLLSVIKFVDCSFQIQSDLATISLSKAEAACHPFGQSMSLSGFAMTIFKYYFFNYYDGCSVLKPYTGFYSKASGPEYEYLSFLAFTKPNEKIVHAFNRREGQMRFDNVIVDGYSPESQTVYQFHGCMVIIK